MQCMNCLTFFMKTFMNNQKTTKCMKTPYSYSGAKKFFRGKSEYKNACPCIEDMVKHSINRSSYENPEGVKKLCDLGYGDNGTIVRSLEHPHLYALGLRPGKRLCCFGYQLFGGPMVVEIEKRQVALNKELLNHIYISTGDSV